MKNSYSLRSGMHAIVVMLFFGMCTITSLLAQTGVGINPSGNPANSSAGLDVDYPNKGLLIPRVTLASAADVSTIPGPATSLLVYNTGLGGLTPAGFYYWSGSSWTAVAGSGGGGGGGGDGITLTPACTTFNEDYVIRGNGNGTWECTDALMIDDTNGAISMGMTPNTSYRLRIDNNVGIGSSPSSGYELSVDGDAHFTGYVGINTTPSTSYGLRVNDNVGIGFSPSSSYQLSVDGQTQITDGLRVGTTSSPPSNGIIAAGQVDADGFRAGTSSSNTNGVYCTGEIRSNNAFNLQSSTSGTGTAVVRTSSGLLRPQSSTIKVKENIRDLAIDKKNILQLRPVSFNLKAALGGDPDVGLIAEEVEKLVPELVVYGPKRYWIGDTGLTETDKEGSEIVDRSQQECYSVRYDKVGVYLIPIIAEQEQIIQSQQATISELNTRMAAQDSRINEQNELIQDQQNLVNELSVRLQKQEALLSKLIAGSELTPNKK
jgi:hypothetical protein